MFKALLILALLFAASRFVWGMRQGYLGREIEHPPPRPGKRRNGE